MRHWPTRHQSVRHLRRLFPYGSWRRVFNAAAVLLTLATPAAARQQAETTVILAFGDSLTAGYGVAPKDSFPAQLERRLNADGYHVRVINGGVSGDTTSGGRNRLAWALADKPDLVILELGANDALRAIDPAVTRANLDAILTELDTRGVPVLLAGMLAPPNLGARYGRTFNGLFPDIAAKHGVAFYPFFLEGVAADAKLNQSDGMHPNADGVAVIVGRIAPQVARLIDGSGGR